MKVPAGPRLRSSLRRQDPSSAPSVLPNRLAASGAAGPRSGMRSKREVLGQLKRDELLVAVDRCRIGGSGRDWWTPWRSAAGGALGRNGLPKIAFQPGLDFALGDLFPEEMLFAPLLIFFNCFLDRVPIDLPISTPNRVGRPNYVVLPYPVSPVNAAKEEPEGGKGLFSALADREAPEPLLGPAVLVEATACPVLDSMEPTLRMELTDSRSVADREP